MWINRVFQMLCLGCVGLFGSAVAHAELLRSDLGLWLSQKAAPQLVDTIGKHPRFKGEALTVVAMRDGRPTAQGSRLSQEVEEYVTHRLLAQSQARITWQDQKASCERARPTPYLLGIEIKATGRSRASVTVALVDVEENIWVPGTSLRWSGTLNSAERKALRQAVTQAANGNVDRPLSASNPEPVLKQLLAQIRCAMPAGIDGSVHVSAAETAEDTALVVDVAEQLRLALKRSPLFELAASADQAQWLARLTLEQSATQAALTVVLTEAAGRGTQRLASVYIEGIQETVAVAPAALPEPPAAATTVAADTPLLGSIIEREIAACSQQPERQCAQLELEQLQRAWVITFRSRGGQISGQSCAGTVTRSDAANRRFRVALDRDDDVGFYAIATTNQRVARTLGKLLRRAPGSCNETGQSATAWLQRLTQTIERYDAAIDWQAIHLASDSSIALADR